MLTSKQLDDIKELQRLCEVEESIQLKLNWDMLRTRGENENYDFFHYEDDVLVGFIGLYGFGNKVELCGMVHQQYRRRGIFSKLYMKAMKVINQQNFKYVLLNAPSNSATAKGFLSTRECTYAFTEYQMKWTETELNGEGDVRLRKSTPNDFDTEVQLNVLCFGFTESDAKQYKERIDSDETQHSYMVDHRGRTVGMLRVAHTDGEAWIYGFAVHPDFQGIGIGRKALSHSVMREHQNGYPIFLEVEAKNSHALGLYESCGFKTFHSQNYYALEK